MDKIVVKVVNSSNNALPMYETNGSAGCDLRAFIPEPVVIRPGKRKLIPTGLKIALPEGYEAQVRPRSGLALNSGLTCLNTPGTIDSDYRGDVGVILINLGEFPVIINNNDRIAQLVINKVEQAMFKVVTTLDETKRGEGGFGHTGKN